MNKEPKKKLTKREVLVALIVFMLASTYIMNLLAGGSSQPKMTEEQKTAERYSVDAVVCAKAKVTEMLKAPTTAKFPRAHTRELAQYVGLAEDKYPQYVVNSYVDAQNSFGAMIRSNYSCNAYCDTAKSLCICDCTIQ